jgi:HEAT repeats
VSSRALGGLLVAVLSLAVWPVWAAGVRFPEGWSRWRIHAVAGGGRWCCPQRLDDSARTSCERHGQLSSEWDDHAPARDLFVLAFHRLGSLQRVSVMEADCAPPTGEVHDLSDFDTASSAQWLTGLVTASGIDRQTALAVLAVHDDQTVLGTLKRLATEAALEVREAALTWLARTRAAQSLAFVRAMMTGDPNHRIRQHACSALATINPSTLLDDLSSVGRSDADEGVRGKAWFWLALRAPVGTDAALASAVHTEPSAQVRKELIFAQSRLPDDRATSALLSSLRDRGVPREVRKEAMFWLAESKDERAQAAVGELLLDPGSRRR